ncbi:hypothetical protein QPM17_19425 [Marinobacter sp. TBZ242]|uniref:MSHA biogenesis protein MshP n=1 Tax=Marinobacter azerbaijanicus TaxID=3050455 RepID=A0ABT7IGL9_9GAMM|nr:hypothetical protein [Marinobacter sp. TBZ242]MDL0433314.1 hypothetical protein [Marinobacter sp. TBZ242]
MCPDKPLKRHSGAGLPVALFVVTVLAFLVLGMSQLQQSSGESISLQIQSQRAFFAAESGAQVAVRDVLDADSCGGINSPLDFDAADGLQTCGAALACESVTADIGGSGGNTVYTITSTGQCGAGADQATRVVEVRVR